MTVFDRLEAQLLDAHPHRVRRSLPRPAPRTIVAFAAVVATVIVVAIAGLAGGSSTTPSQPAAQPGDAVPPIAPGGTTVAVLDGTRHVKPVLAAAETLRRHGWKIGTVQNYTDQNLDSSCVDFRPGYSAAATEVASQLGIQNVVPASRLVAALAGPQAGVVVIIGRDRLD